MTIFESMSPDEINAILEKAPISSPEEQAIKQLIKLRAIKLTSAIASLYQTELQSVILYGELTNKSKVTESDFGEEVYQAELLRKNNALALEWALDIDANTDAYMNCKKDKKIEDNRLFREQFANTATNISRNDARRDLFQNQTNPYLFRKYILDLWEATKMNPFFSDFKCPPKKVCVDYTSKMTCGLEIYIILHPCIEHDCPRNTMWAGGGYYDPIYYSNFDINTMTYESIKSKFGVPFNSSCNGKSCTFYGAGYCYDGTLQWHVSNTGQCVPAAPHLKNNLLAPSYWSNSPNVGYFATE